MSKFKKLQTLLSVAGIIAVVLIVMFAINACDSSTTPTPTTTPGGTTSIGTGTTVNPTTGLPTGTVLPPKPTVTPLETIPLGSYNRTDTSGISVGSTLVAGVSADMSAYTSPNGIVVLSDSLYVSDETGMAVFKLSKSGDVQAKYTADIQVNGLATDGTSVFVLQGGANGQVVKLSASDLKSEAVVSVGHTPTDMVFAGEKAYVTNRFSNTVSVITVSDLKVKSTIDIDGREPSSAVVAGDNVYVACHLPDESTSEKVISANVAIISSKDDKVVKTLELVNGSSGVKDICVSPDGKTVYISQIVARYAYPTTQLDRAWINSNGVSIIDTANMSVTCTVLLDEVDLGAANPWGITVSSDGKKLVVALSGLNELMIVDIPKMNDKINEVVLKKNNRVKTLDDIVDYLPFLNDCRTRVTVGVGARSIVEKDGVLYCANYFDGTVSAVTLSSLEVNTLKFVAQPEASVVRQGQIIWSDANNCYQKWQSCNSCHPDAIIDGFNWDNLNDGIGGGGKSAKSMLYSHRTPPVMITGIRPNAETAVAAGMKFIQFNTLDESKLAYIDEYLKSLTPITSPYLTKDGTLTESAAQGKEIFDNNCASCHSGPLFTDLKKHDVGSNTFSGDSGEYDTPTLVEVWRTAPYMHDGSMNTLEEVAKFFKKDLSDEDAKKVADYVRSISGMNEQFGVEQVRGTKTDDSLIYNLYEDGATIESISFRKQTVDHVDVVVALSVFDKDGKQVYYCDTGVANFGYNTTAVIKLNDAIVLPEGGSYTVSFFSSSNGNSIATTFTSK